MNVEKKARIKRHEKYQRKKEGKRKIEEVKKEEKQ
jgi:hypothetical protein